MSAAVMAIMMERATLTGPRKAPSAIHILMSAPPTLSLFDSAGMRVTKRPNRAPVRIKGTSERGTKEKERKKIEKGKALSSSLVFISIALERLSRNARTADLIIICIENPIRKQTMAAVAAAVRENMPIPLLESRILFSFST